MDSLFQHPPTLENDRARLVPLSEDHLDGLCTVGLDPSLWTVSINRIRTREDLQRYAQTAIQQRTAGQSLPFTIMDKRTNQVAGCTRFGNFAWEHRRVEIGWTWIGVAFQQTGLNRACKYALLNYAFHTLQMNRVELKTDALNAKSRDAMRKMGATEEGVLRQHMITEDGRVRDTVYFSIVSGEWERIKREKFAAFIHE